MSIPGYTNPNKFIQATNSPKHAIYMFCMQSKKYKYRTLTKHIVHTSKLP